MPAFPKTPDKSRGFTNQHDAAVALIEQANALLELGNARAVGFAIDGSEDTTVWQTRVIRGSLLDEEHAEHYDRVVDVVGSAFYDFVVPHRVVVRVEVAGVHRDGEADL